MLLRLTIPGATRPRSGTGSRQRSRLTASESCSKQAQPRNSTSGAICFSLKEYKTMENQSPVPIRDPYALHAKRRKAGPILDKKTRKKRKRKKRVSEAERRGDE